MTDANQKPASTQPEALPQFTDLGLIEPILKAIGEEGYETPTPIQARAIGPILEGRDILGCAQTGTGKTAAFALPILQLLHKEHEYPTKGKHPIRALILSPTRELAGQIGENFEAYGRHLPLRHTVVFGGVRQGPQAKALKRGVDVLAATPGRLMDLMGQGLIKLDRVEIFVLDEFDRMLDMGFIDDIRLIVSRLPKQRQSLLFSATMPNSIRNLAEALVNDPVEIHIAPEAPAASTVEQKIYMVETMQKTDLLVHLLQEDESVTRALVFSRTKRGADRLLHVLKHHEIAADAVHADRPQQARERAVRRFATGKIRVLVASDVAARGLDIDQISHVINFDLPDEAEVYIHRIGRTGRAGQAGTAWSFCSMNERLKLDEIEKLLTEKIEVVEEHAHKSAIPTKKPKSETPAPTGIHTAYRRPAKRRRL